MSKTPTTFSQIQQEIDAINQKLVTQSGDITSLKSDMVGVKAALAKLMPTPPPPPEKISGPVYPRVAPNAWLYQKLTAGAPLHPNSDLFTAEFQRQLLATTNTLGCNIYGFTAPLYNAKSTDPTVRVTATPYQTYGILPGLQDGWNAVPLRPDMLPAAGRDAEMCVYVTDIDRLYEFYGFDPKALTAPRGGWMDNVDSNPGAWTGNTGFGIMATGLPYACLQVSVAELLNGEITHAVALSLQYADFYPNFSWPAQRTDGWYPSDGSVTNPIPEGLRFYLDPAADLSKLHRIAQIVGTGWKTYPGVVGDKTGATPSIRFENPQSRLNMGLPDPYPDLLAGVPSYEVFKDFPWSSLRWLPSNYGHP